MATPPVASSDAIATELFPGLAFSRGATRATRHFCAGELLCAEEAVVCVPSSPDQLLALAARLPRPIGVRLTDAQVHVFLEEWNSIERTVKQRAPSTPTQGLFSSLYLALQPSRVVAALMELFCPPTEGCLGSTCDLLRDSEHHSPSVIEAAWLNTFLSRLGGEDDVNSVGSSLRSLLQHSQRLALMRGLLLRLDCNSFQGLGAPLQAAPVVCTDANMVTAMAPAEMYLSISRLNHSCRPNAFASSIGSLPPSSGEFAGTPLPHLGGFMQIRACAPIAPGDEVCISYLSSADLLDLSQEERARRLMLEKQFICACARCKAGEFSRSLRCRTCGYASLSVAPGHLVACSRAQCRRCLPPLAEKTSLLEAERALVGRFDVIERICAVGGGAGASGFDVVLQTEKFLSAAKSTLGPQHATVRAGWALLRDAHEGAARWAAAARAGQRIVWASLLTWLGARVWKKESAGGVAEEVAVLLGSLSAPASDQICGASSSVVLSEATEDELLDRAFQALFPAQPLMCQGEASTAATAPLFLPSFDWLPAHFQLAVEMERTADAWTLRTDSDSEKISNRSRAAPLLSAALHIQSVLHGKAHVFVAQLQQKLDALAAL